MMLPSPEI